MKKEYDFSEGQRGRFYKADAIFNLPVYLDKDNRALVEKIVEDKHLEVSTVVNELIRFPRANSPRSRCLSARTKSRGGCSANQAPRVRG